MSYRIFVKEEAHHDIEEAYFYYEQQQQGLGEKFLAELEKRYADLSSHPKYYSYVANDSLHALRDVKLDTFPYFIIYEISGEDVIVYSVHLTHKKPKD